jgi:hypothetical protein
MFFTSFSVSRWGPLGSLLKLQHNDRVHLFFQKTPLSRVAILILTAAFLFHPSAEAAKAKPAAAIPDRDYVSALAAANEFLHAWQVQDRAGGVILLSDAAKHQTSEERIEQLLAPGMGVLQSYEIGQGKKLKAGVYSFPVTLFVIGTGKTVKPIRPRFSQIVVAQTGRDDWAIDKLP